MTSQSHFTTSLTIFMTSQPLHSWHEIPYIWHHLQRLWHLIPYPCDITDTIFLNTDQLYLTSNSRCRDNTNTISEITTSICVSLCSHTLYRWYNIHCIYDMAPTIFKAKYALYMTSQPTIYDIAALSPLHQSIISHIKLIISESTSTASLSSHPDYQSYNPHCTYDNTGTICMISYEYIRHHIQSLWYHTMVWTSHTLYSCHHAQDTCHHIHCSWAMTYSVLRTPHLQYVCSQTHYMYGIIWILCDITTTR